MSLYDLLNSRRDILALEPEARVAAVRALAWQPKQAEVWVLNMTLISRLGPENAAAVINVLNAIADRQMPLPDGTPDYALLAMIEARNSLRASPGVNIADRVSLPLLLLLRDAAPQIAPLLNHIIGWAWNHVPEYAEATAEQIAEAAARVALADEAEALIRWAGDWYEQVRANVGAALTAGALPSKAELREGLEV